jgi:hypothetical protein
MRTITNLSLLVIAAWTALMLVGCSTYPDDTVTVSPASTEAGKAAPAKKASAVPTSFLDGTYRIPKDMKPGRYQTKGPADQDGFCYWERLSGFSGDGDEIIANGNASGQGIVTIKKTDKGFGTSGCQAWRMIK